MRIVRLSAVVAAIILLGIPRILNAAPSTMPTTVERWGVFEAAFTGPSDGNPFFDVELSARFTSGDKTFTARGFYDGGGIYRVRFMPPALGAWRLVTRSNRKELNDQTGEFTCVAPSAGNHGPVRVAHVYHFAYADGTPFFPIGTTSYTWVHQPDALESRTLATLKSSPFNKVRMCVFPTAYKKGTDEPVRFPFEKTADGKFDLARFNPEFFHHLEQRLLQLDGIGVQADLILFHPYDKGEMGFDRMTAAQDDHYARYVVARLSAYRNIWWSLANEWDLMREKSESDFDRLGQIVQAEDPSDHLRSIHFSGRMFDPDKPWVTHSSVQNGAAVDDFGRASLYRDVVPKPVVYDEVRYEGNLDRRWGQMSAEQMVAHFWFGTIGGTYVGHGETFRSTATTQDGQSLQPAPPGGMPTAAANSPPAWSGRGGEIIGKSAPRIAFLKSIVENGPPEGIEPIDRFFNSHIAGKVGFYYLIYFGPETPAEWTFELPGKEMKEGTAFHVDVLDTWNMTVTPVDGAFKLKKNGSYGFASAGNRMVSLPGKPWMALRITRTGAVATSQPASPETQE